MSQGRRVSFVVRVVQDSRGRVSGVIERVATGAKETFTGTGAIGRVIIQMLQREDTSQETSPRACSIDSSRATKGEP